MLVCSTVVAAVTSQQLNRASKLHRKGVQAMQSGDLEKARQSFEKALGDVPMFPDAHIGLGQLALAEREYENALAHFEQARDGYAELGESLFDIRMKRYTDARNAIATIDDQIRHVESSSSVSSGESRYSVGGQNAIKVARMRNQQEQLRAIQPPDPEKTSEPPGEVFFYIGNALFQLNRRSEAIQAWETCREKSPEFPMVYNNLALAYMQEGRLEVAKESLDKAEELGFPVNPQFKADLDKALSQSRSPGAG
jgi:tetratricopeptide (TPR) repeat protein